MTELTVACSYRTKVEFLSCCGSTGLNILFVIKYNSSIDRDILVGLFYMLYHKLSLIIFNL
jgi:hypothetical protein